MNDAEYRKAWRAGMEQADSHVNLNDLPQHWEWKFKRVTRKLSGADPEGFCLECRARMPQSKAQCLSHHWWPETGQARRRA